MYVFGGKVTVKLRSSTSCPNSSWYHLSASARVSWLTFSTGGGHIWEKEENNEIFLELLGDEVAGENLEMTKPRQRTPISAFRGSKHTNIQILTRISAGSRGKGLNVLSGRGFGLERLFARVWFFSKSAASAAFC